MDQAGTHVDLIGAYKADMREADDALISGGSLFVDSRETTIDHIGELTIPNSSGVIAADAIMGTSITCSRPDQRTPVG